VWEFAASRKKEILFSGGTILALVDKKGLMKKPLYLYAGTILVVLGVCLAVGGQTTADIVAQNKRIAYLEVEKLWNEGDLAVADQVYAPGQILHLRGESYPFGPDAAKKAVASMRKAFPDFEFKIEDIVAEGDKLAIRYIFTGTHQGKIWGIAPTGKKISVTQTTIIRFADGKMIEAWEDYDEYGMRLQLGMELKVKEIDK
jgi:predicted ester cyclase